MLSDLMNWATDQLPMLHTLQPITIAGLGITMVGALLYYITRTPELLLVVLTAGMYAVVPLVHRAF